MTNVTKDVSQKPGVVRKAMLRGDTKLLSLLGKKGAAARALKKAHALVLEQELQKLLLEDAKEHAENTRVGWDDDYKP
jgi:hypothetical protein